MLAPQRPASAGGNCAGAFVLQTRQWDRGGGNGGWVRARAVSVVCGWSRLPAGWLVGCYFSKSSTPASPASSTTASPSHTPHTPRHPHTTHRTRARTHHPPAYPTAASGAQTLPRNSCLRSLGTVGLKLGALLLALIRHKCRDVTGGA